MLGKLLAGNHGELLVLAMEDVTERRRAEADLKAIGTYAQDIVDTVREPLLMLDTTLRVQSANRAFYQTFHVSPKETENHLIYELGNGQWDIPDLRTLLEDVVPTSSVFSDFELEHTFPVIGRRVMLLNARQLLAGSHAELLVLAMEDVTERRRAEEEVERAKEAAEAASKTKSLFLANMSHELRTPLNAILGYSEMLQEEAADRQFDGFTADLEKINAAGRHLLALINDILDLSKIEAGKMELFLEDFDVAAMIDEVASTVVPLVEKNANELHVEMARDLGMMHADQIKVRQSLFNLLSNAAKFTREGHVTLDTRREQMDGTEWIVFRVTDTGIGLNSNQILKLFQAFAQADASTTRKFGGTGSGPGSYAPILRQMMGGDVVVNSTPGKGSTFTIKLPAAVIESPNTPESELIGEVGAIFETDSYTPDDVTDGAEPLPLAKTCVLVIDDGVEQRELMERYLSMQGFCIRTARGGEEGLRLARELRPAAITLDVMMPGMDGWRVLAALKADPELCDIPVIILTVVDDRKRGFTLGASDYATKPVDRDGLAKILKKYMFPNPHCQLLLVEDDTATRKLVKAMLENAGWRVCEAENGLEALACMKQESPSLILLDLIMPVMNGFEFAAHVRAHDEWRLIPIVVMTAHELNSEDRLRLNGFVEAILPTEGTPSESLLSQVRDLLLNCTVPVVPPMRSSKGEIERLASH